MKIAKSFATFFSIVFLVVGFAFGLNQLVGVPTKADNNQKSFRSFSVSEKDRAVINIKNDISPWLKLKQGKGIETKYVGDDTAIQSLEGGSLRPLSLASADFNSDGYTDLISGYADMNGGGILTFHKANKEAFAPEDEQILAGIRNGEFPVSFEKEATALKLSVAPDFILTGRFVKDSTIDLVVASRGSRTIYVLSSNGKDGFDTPQEIQIDGEITSIASDHLDDTKGLSGLVVSTRNEKGFEVLVFDGSGELCSTKPKSVALSKEVSSMILGTADGMTTEKDLFLLADGEILRISHIGKSLENPTMIDLPFHVNDFALGEFIRDRRAKTEIAALTNGSVYYVQNGSLDTRPFTTKEVREHFAKYGRGRNMLINTNDDGNSLANNWTIAEEQILGVYEFNRQNSQSLLLKSRITGNEADDLLVLNPSDGKVRVLFKEPIYEQNRQSFTGETKIENIGFSHTPLAALPIRLNVMGQ
jgi:hypothetical protein